MYLEIIQSHKNKINKNAGEGKDLKIILTGDIAANILASKTNNFLTENDIKLASEKIKEVNEMK
jgi:hypothetical protein